MEKKHKCPRAGEFETCKKCEHAKPHDFNYRCNGSCHGEPERGIQDGVDEEGNPNIVTKCVVKCVEV